MIQNLLLIFICGIYSLRNVYTRENFRSHESSGRKRVSTFNLHSRATAYYSLSARSALCSAQARDLTYFSS